MQVQEGQHQLLRFLLQPSDLFAFRAVGQTPRVNVPAVCQSRCAQERLGEWRPLLRRNA